MSFDQGHALVIGVGSYQYNPKANIPISVKDAQAVRSVLLNADLCGYPPEQVNFLHDAQATRDGILGALDALAEKTNTDHTILLYYCGHGAYGTDGFYYLTTHDTKEANGKVEKGTGIEETELLVKLRKFPAKRLILLFNACHSGDISPNLDFGEEDKTFGNINLPTNAIDALLSTGEGRIIITASRPEQKSWIGTGVLSIFTQALVDGLSGKDYVTNNNGYISAFSLYESMYYAIQEAAQTLGKIQEPELTVLRGVGPFPVSLYRGATSLGSFSPRESLPAGTATREVNPKQSERLFQIKIKNLIASGKGAVIVDGDISESTIVTGEQRNINTGGGAHISGDVKIESGDFVGRDKFIHGDEVRRDKSEGDPVDAKDG
jgi:hypothetical protein